MLTAGVSGSKGIARFGDGAHPLLEFPEIVLFGDGHIPFEKSFLMGSMFLLEFPGIVLFGVVT
jgi:hypothetical protein